MFHREKVRYPGASDLVSFSVVDEGPLLCSIRFELKLSSSSSIVYHVSLDALNTFGLRFACHVKWAEKRKLLKVEFPLRVSPMGLVATYEVPFGYLQRPTHFNTSWEIAKFEVCGHRWADVSEYGFGVSFLNNCKYGHSVLSHTFALSLLRSPINPDPTCDIGEHEFEFSVFPHQGSFQQANVHQVRFWR